MQRLDGAACEGTTNHEHDRSSNTTGGYHQAPGENAKRPKPLRHNEGRDQQVYGAESINPTPPTNTTGVGEDHASSEHTPCYRKGQGGRQAG